MSVNRYKPHVVLIPEDDADRQLAIGFLNHHAVNNRVIDIRPPAGGWLEVLDVFQKEFAKYLHNFSAAHVVMVIDFDSRDEDRKTQFANSILEDLKPRVFLVGSKDEPESVKRELKMSFEAIGKALAQDCHMGEFKMWGNPHFQHNTTELQRLIQVVKPIAFPDK